MLLYAYGLYISTCIKPDWIADRFGVCEISFTENAVNLNKFSKSKRNVSNRAHRSSHYFKFYPRENTRLECSNLIDLIDTNISNMVNNISFSFQNMFFFLQEALQIVFIQFACIRIMKI